MDRQLVETALKSLDDIVLPPPVSYWPQTWGWGVVALVVLAVVVALAWRWLRYRKANRYRWAALAELRLLEQRVPDRSEDVDRQLAVILKRTALAAWPRAEIASLSGPSWAQFLAGHAPGGKLDERLIALVSDEEYRRVRPEKTAQDQNSKLFGAARRWIEGHHVSA